VKELTYEQLKICCSTKRSLWPGSTQRKASCSIYLERIKNKK